MLTRISREEYLQLKKEGKLHTIPIDELNRLWNSFPEKPLKLSVCYMVTPVKIDSTRQVEARRVIEKETGYYQIRKVSTP